MGDTADATQILSGEDAPSLCGTAQICICFSELPAQQEFILQRFWRSGFQSQGLVSLGAPRQNLSHACPDFGGHHPSLTFFGLQRHHSNLSLCPHAYSILPVSWHGLPFSLSLPPYKDTSRYVLNYICKKNFIPNEAPFSGSRGKMWTQLLWGYNQPPTDKVGREGLDVNLSRSQLQGCAETAEGDRGRSIIECWGPAIMIRNRNRALLTATVLF